MKAPLLVLAIVLAGCANTQKETSQNNSTATNPIKSPDAEKKVYVTNSGKKYHSEGCRFLSKSKIAVALAEARKSHTPCSKCVPSK